MMFSRCFTLFTLIAAYKTAEAFKVNKDPEKNLPPTKAKSHLLEGFLPPSFCHGLECPKYRLVEKYSGFEHRDYDATQWISTATPLETEKFNTGLLNLYKYMNGSNSAGLKLRETVPLLLLVSLGKTSPVKVTISKFLSVDLKNPPKPLESTIFLQKYPEASMYVRCFTGYGTPEDFSKQVKALAAELNTLGLPYDKSFFGTNMYGHPSNPSDSHNEVWFLAVQK